LRVLRSLPAALLMALMAPPLSAVAVVAVWLTRAALSEGTPSAGGLIASASGSESWASQGPGVLLAAVIGGYLLGTLPAFVAGLPHRWVQKRWGAAVTASVCAVVGTATYFGTTGAHLLSGATDASEPLWTGLPIGAGLALASLIVSRLERSPRAPTAPSPAPAAAAAGDRPPAPASAENPQTRSPAPQSRPPG
jgi:hypothetical protein